VLVACMTAIMLTMTVSADVPANIIPAGTFSGLFSQQMLMSLFSEFVLVAAMVFPVVFAFIGFRKITGWVLARVRRS
jgi:hypothetical protein